MGNLLAPPKKKIIIQGLDSSGKTTFLYAFTQGKVIPTAVTAASNSENILFEGKDLHLWDLGGCDNMKKLWYHYYKGADGLVFLVDTQAKERMEEAKTDLERIMGEEYLKKLPILFIGTKSDLGGDPLTVSEIEQQLDLANIASDRKYHTVLCPAVDVEAVKASMVWLANAL